MTVANSRGSAALGPQRPLLLNRAIRWRLGWPQSPIRVISRPTDFRHVRELVNRLVKGVGIKMRRDARSVNYRPSIAAETGRFGSRFTAIRRLSGLERHLPSADLS